MVVAPRLSEDFTFFIELTGQILSQIPKPVLEFFLERIQDVVDVVHGLDGLLLVFLDFTKQINAS